MTALLWWLTYRVNDDIVVFIQPAHSCIAARMRAVIAGVDGTFQVLVNGMLFEISLLDPRKLRHFGSGLFDTTGPVPVVAAMPGKVVQLLVKAGDLVQEGQGVAVIEAMKMQNELKSPKTGKIDKVNVTQNQTINAGEVLVVVS